MANEINAKKNLTEILTDELVLFWKWLAEEGLADPHPCDSEMLEVIQEYMEESNGEKS